MRTLVDLSIKWVLIEMLGTGRQFLGSVDEFPFAGDILEAIPPNER